MSKLILVVPCYCRYDLLQKLIESAEAGTRRPDKYWIFDTHETGGGLHQAVADGQFAILPTMQIDVTGNIGLSAVWNRVLDAGEDYVVFSNDDVEFDANALENLLTAAETQEGDFFHPSPHATKFCVFLIKQSCYRKVGRFDEKFWPGYFEDNDYQHRMRLAGAVEVGVPDVKYLHVGSATLKSFSDTEKKAHNARFEKNRDYYVKKWGGMPGHETRKTPGA